MSCRQGVAGRRGGASRSVARVVRGVGAGSRLNRDRWGAGAARRSGLCRASRASAFAQPLFGGVARRGVLGGGGGYIWGAGTAGVAGRA